VKFLQQYFVIEIEAKSKVILELLWSPYGIGQTIIFSSCGFFFYLLSSIYLSFFLFFLA